MMKKSSTLFPDKEQFQKIDDAAIGWAHRKRKTSNPKLRQSESMRFSTAGKSISSRVIGSPNAQSQRKAVRIKINDGEGNVSIEPASPAVSHARKKIIYKSESSHLDEGDINDSKDKDDLAVTPPVKADTAESLP